VTGSYGDGGEDQVSFSYESSTKQLTINGTEEGDFIQFEGNAVFGGSDLSGFFEYEFSELDLESIVVNGLGGNDYIDLQNLEFSDSD